MSSSPDHCTLRCLLGRPAPLCLMRREAGRVGIRQAPPPAACANRGHTPTRQVERGWGVIEGVGMMKDNQTLN